MLSIKDVTIDRDNRHILTIDAASAVKGEVISILGSNGAGKSSLLKTLASEWHHKQGDIVFGDKLLVDWPRKARARHIAVLPQASQLTFPFRAGEVVEIGATPLNINAKQLKEQVEYWMSVTNTYAFIDREYLRLSGGERQRVQLARVLLQISQAEEAPLLLLDEPTSAQDLGQQHALLAMLRELSRSRGIIIVAILHDLNLASRYSDKVWLLHDKKLLASGSPQSVLTPTQVEEVWGYKPENIINAAGESLLF